MLLVLFFRGAARRVKNKTSDFIDYVCSSGADIFALTETWLKDADDACRIEATPTGFKFLDHARSNITGGGTVLLLRDNMEVSKLAAGERQSFEFSEWLIKSGLQPLRLVTVLYTGHLTHTTIMSLLLYLLLNVLII